MQTSSSKVKEPRGGLPLTFREAPPDEMGIGLEYVYLHWNLFSDLLEALRMVKKASFEQAIEMQECCW